MTTYTPAANIATDPNDPVSSEVGTALKNNPLAIQEGDTTAPRVSALANGPILSFDNSVNKDAGGETIVSLNIGQSRKAVITAHLGLVQNYTDSTAIGGSQLRLQGSNNNSTWTTLVTIATVGAVAVEINGPVTWNGRSGAGDAAYQWYRVFASGNDDHEIEGRAMIECLGTEDES